jgi:hypothetical protein
MSKSLQILRARKSMISRCRGIADDFCARRLTVNRVIAAFAEKFAALFLEMAQ